MKIVIIENEDMASSLRKALEDRAVDLNGLGINGKLAEDVTRQEPDVILMDKHIRLGSFTFMPDCMSLKRKGQMIRLSINQNKLLYLLCACINITVTRDEIHRMLWPDVIVIDQSVNNLIFQLRKFLQVDNHIRIENIRGVGYRLSVKS